MSETTRKQLSDEDQARVDRYLKSGYNQTERRDFKPFILLLVLACIVWGIGAGAGLVGRLSGIE